MRHVGHHNLLPAERHGASSRLWGSIVPCVSRALSHELSVSEMTIRRDLEHLESKGFCSRTHGGAILKLRLDKEPLYANNELTHTTEKERIARAAAAMIKPGETVFLSAGTTTAQMLRHIDPNLEVRIVTHNAGTIAEPHARGIELIVLGGQYYAQMNAFQGTMPVESMRRFFASKMFLGVDGVSLQEGLTTPSIGLADVDRAMIASDGRQDDRARRQQQDRRRRRRGDLSARSGRHDHHRRRRRRRGARGDEATRHRGRRRLRRPRAAPEVRRLRPAAELPQRPLRSAGAQRDSQHRERRGHVVRAVERRLDQLRAALQAGRQNARLALRLARIAASASTTSGPPPDSLAARST